MRPDASGSNGSESRGELDTVGRPRAEKRAIEQQRQRLVPLDIVDEIHEALKATNDDRLSPVFHALNARHSFETIRLVRLMR